MPEKPRETDPTALATVRMARPGDAMSLRPILEHWIRDRNTRKLITGEIAGVISAIETSSGVQSKRHFVVAENPNGDLLGTAGIQPASQEMKKFTTSPNAGELINVYVDPNFRDLGIGGMLVGRLEDIGRGQSYDELVVNSGPRYRETGWPFWIACYGDPIGVAEELYGVGGDAMVWRTSLDTEK